MAIIIVIIVSTVLSIALANGVSYMHENFPDYRGEDLFGE
jgi:hypothetical protein